MSAMLEMTNTRRLKRTHYGIHSENLVLCLMMPVCHEHLITSINIWLCCFKSMPTKTKLNLSVERFQRHLWVLLQVSCCICFVLLCVQTLPLQTSAQNEGQCQLCWFARNAEKSDQLFCVQCFAKLALPQILISIFFLLINIFRVSYSVDLWSSQYMLIVDTLSSVLLSKIFGQFL